MDSMIFDPEGGDVVRTTNAEGGVYRTTVGPAYYQSWSNFPNGTQFTSTLNFGNDSLDIARDMAVASVKYQEDKVGFFELGNVSTFTSSLVKRKRVKTNDKRPIGTYQLPSLPLG